MSAIDRIKKIVDFKELNKRQFYKKTGLSNGYLDKEREVGHKKMEAICSNFPDINPSWLLTGKGEMLLNEDKQNHQVESNNRVPYYDIDFTAGFVDVVNNQNSNPDSYIIHPFFMRCDYVVRASGQSMAKVINHGDAVGLRRIENWNEFLPFGEIYAIVTKDDLRMIKVITKGIDEATFTLLSKPTDSKKEDFPPQLIPKKNIKYIFKVMASSHLL